jgi:tetrahydromethanopterin S-methyltransferase subunit D
MRIQSAVSSTQATVTGPAGSVRFLPIGSANAAATFTVAGVGSGAPSLAVTVAASGVIKGSRL